MPRTRRTRQFSAARGWAHDKVCMSEDCSGDNDHAKRTQGEFASRVMSTHADDDTRVTAIHGLLCVTAVRGECAKESHLLTIRSTILPDLEKHLDL